MRIFFVTIFFFIHCFSLIAQVSDSIKYQSLEPYDFHLQYLRDNPALLIDVRQFFEFKGRRIKDAINIPSVKDLNMAADTISRNSALFLYCTDGFRSRRAAELCYDMGFGKVYNLEGGIIAWKRDGFPVDKSRIRKKAGEREGERGR
jgi:rhodanese-related sulfurtransferase